MKKRSFWLCLIAGSLATLLALTTAAYGLFSSEALFRRAIAASVDPAPLGADDAALSAFAGDTIRYLTGRQEAWQPAILAPSPAFAGHMAKVRAAVMALPLIMLALLLAGALLVLLGRPFDKRGWYLGAGLVLALVVVLALWAALDFSGFWHWLHVTFIPDGLFPPNEPMMALFPLSLFGYYLVPAGLLLGALLVLVGLCPLAIRHKGSLKAINRKNG